MDDKRWHLCVNITFTALVIGLTAYGTRGVVTILKDPLLVGLNKIVPTVGISLLSLTMVIDVIDRWRNGPG